MKRGPIAGHFAGLPGRRVFVLLREPVASVRARRSVLVVPPFGEEMNKSRRMLAETAQRFCDAGWAVVQPDLYGTGDSEGEFRDAKVECWLEDLELACRHAQARGLPVKAVLAVRLGCALAVAGARRGTIPAVNTSLWWQPVLDGKRHLAQFLRLRVAAASMRGGSEETVDSLRARSAGGETLAVAGYELSPQLVLGLEGLAVEDLPPEAGVLQWFEFVREAGSAAPLPATRFLERARTAGAVATITTLAGEPFWASSEIVRLPEAVELTVNALMHSEQASSARTAGGTQVNA